MQFDLETTGLDPDPRLDLPHRDFAADGETGRARGRFDGDAAERISSSASRCAFGADRSRT